MCACVVCILIHLGKKLNAFKGKITLLKKLLKHIYIHITIAKPLVNQRNS